MLALISDIVVGMSAVTVAVVAFFGLRTWRKELTGKARFEAARNLMHLGFRLQYGFERARNPFTSTAETVARQKGDGETTGEAVIRDEWYSRSRRLEPLSEDLTRFQEAS